MPYAMHSEYLRKLFLDNDLAEARYPVDGRAVALHDIRVPVFAIGTERDHVAPWRSVYKIALHADEALTFLLASGGHNAGIVSPPGDGLRHYRVAARPRGASSVDADTWFERTPQQEGSWWPQWEGWLAQHSSSRLPPPAMGEAICDAPGTYVLQK